LKKLLALFAFSVLLLVPVGAQQVFANHPDLPCPPTGLLNTDPSLITFIIGGPYCYNNIFGLNANTPNCPVGYIPDTIFDLSASAEVFQACTAATGSFPDTTLEAQCQGAAVLLSNHCFAEALASMVGGILLSIDTTAVLVGAIGTDPLITGLVAITMAGIAGQAAWFIHRRKRKIKIE